LYLGVGEVRTIEDVIRYIQGPSAWLRSPSMLDYLFMQFVSFQDRFEYRDEICASIGVFATIFSLIGIFKLKNMRKIFYPVIAIIFVLSCAFGSFLLWKYLYPVLIGAQGIRAIIRISLIALIIFSIGICGFIDKIKNKTVVTLCIILIVIEQIPMYKSPYLWQNYNWSKSKFQTQIKETSKLFPKDVKIVFLDYNFKDKDSRTLPFNVLFENYMYYATLAMWASLDAQKYSINGYSGVVIEQYPNLGNRTIYYQNYDVDVDKYKESNNLLGK
ncbi:hypothetical protein IJ670_06155, partial [bacterium]|nr:hypothetical protein [bacterium]